jgi:hypothetical protein
MKLYDKTKIGKIIAKGGDRSVYKYGENEVIKFSSLVFFCKGVHKKMVHDYTVCRTYFNDYLVPVTDVSDPQKREYIEIQPYIKGEVLSFKHVKDSNILIQVKEIKDISEKMTRDGYPGVDLVGHGGMLKLCLSNILVDEQGKLRIIDIAIMETRSVGFMGYFLILLVPIIKARQRYVFNRFLNLQGLSKPL